MMMRLLLVFAFVMAMFPGVWGQGFISILDVSTIPNEIAIGQTNDIFVEVQNNKGQNYNTTISIEVTNASGPVSGFSGLGNQSYIITGGGGTHTFTFTYSVTGSVQTDIYLFNISLYANNTYIESKSINISVISLVYDSLNVIYPEIAKGERGEFRPLITNNGTTNASGTVSLDVWRDENPIHFYCSDYPNACGTNPRKENITAGESTTFDFLWNIPSPACGYNDFNVTSELTYGGTGSYWVAYGVVETVMLQIDDSYDNEKIATEVYPSEVAKGDEIRVQVAVSNRGEMNTTVSKVDARIEDSSGNIISSIPLTPRIGEPTSGSGLSLNTTGGTVLPGYSCSGAVPAGYFMFIGTIPSNLDLNKDYKANVFLDYGVPRADNGMWNDEMIKDFVIVDLNISSISVTPEVGRQRDLDLTVYVKNIGFETSTSAKVKTVIKNESGYIVKNYSLENVTTIQSGETKSIDYVSWPIPMELDLGNYYVESRVDFGLSQSRTLTKYFEIVSIGINNVSSTPTAPGESSDIILTLNNTGPTNATINTLTLSLVNSSPSVSKSLSTIEVPANSVYNYTPTFYIPLSLSDSGNYMLNVTYIYGNGKTVTDTSTVFNVFPVGIKSFTVPSTGINTSSVPISVTLTNIGNSGVSVFLNLTDNGTTINQTTVTATSNSDTTVDFNINITLTGTHNITITANYAGLPQPLVRSDTILIYTASFAPDLSVVSISPSPSSPTTNQNVSITATVNNSGNLSANNVTVEFLLDNVSQANNTIDVASSSSNSTVFYWNATPSGTYNIAIVADPDNSISEADETNNNATVSITVTAPAPPSSGGGGGGGGGGSPSYDVHPCVKNLGKKDLKEKQIAELAYECGHSRSPAKYIISPSYASLAGVFASQDEVVLSPELSDRLFESHPSSKQGRIIKKEPTILGEDIYKVAADYVLETTIRANKIVIARGDLGADSITASTFANLIGAKILLVKPDEVPYPTLDVLDKYRPNTVYIIGGEDAVSPEVANTVGKYAYKVERISGNTRYETSLEIARRIMEMSDPSVVVVTDGKEPVTYAASLAVKLNAPLLYMDENSPEEVFQFIGENDFRIVARLYQE